MSNENNSQSNIKWYGIVLLILYLFVGNIISCSTSKRIGAECCDESYSQATGSGACSWHGGVRRWKYKYWYSDIDEPYRSFFKLTIPGNINSTKSCDEDE